MAFRFSLAVLLRLRLTLEQVEERKLLGLRHDAQRIDLAIAQNVAARRGQRLRQAALLAGSNSSRDAGLTAAEPTTAEPSVAGPKVTGLTGADLQFAGSCWARLELGEQQLRQQLAAKQEEILRQLALFAEVRRQREVLEALRDRHLELYRAEERRRQQRNLDDLFLLQLLRARQGRRQG